MLSNVAQASLLASLPAFQKSWPPQVTDFFPMVGLDSLSRRSPRQISYRQRSDLNTQGVDLTPDERLPPYRSFVICEDTALFF